MLKKQNLFNIDESKMSSIGDKEYLKEYLKQTYFGDLY